MCLGVHRVPPHQACKGPSQARAAAGIRRHLAASVGGVGGGACRAGWLLRWLASRLCLAAGHGLPWDGALLAAVGAVGQIPSLQVRASQHADHVSCIHINHGASPSQAAASRRARRAVPALLVAAAGGAAHRLQGGDEAAQRAQQAAAAQGAAQVRCGEKGVAVGAVGSEPSGNPSKGRRQVLGLAAWLGLSEKSLPRSCCMLHRAAWSQSAQMAATIITLTAAHLPPAPSRAQSGRR